MPIKRFEPTRAVEITKPKYGSAYRIGGQLILTAKHLFPEGVGSTCKVRDKRTFGEIEARVIWTAASADVALVELPQTMKSCESVVFGRIPSEAYATKIKFDLYGWPQWARTTRPGEPDKAGGRHIDGDIYLADRSPEELLVLEPIRKPEAPSADARGSEWAGISGAAVVCHGLVVAVHRQHQNPRRAASLEATPLSTLYNDPAWRTLLRNHGIPVEPEDVIPLRDEQGEHYRDRVIGEVASKLVRFGKDHLKRVAESICKLPGADASNINLDFDEGRLSQEIATCIVGHVAVTDVVGCLVSLMQDLDAERPSHLADIVNLLLPLNYAPDSIRRLAERIGKDQFGFVEDEVSTRTLAEILMAGYDQQPAKFSGLTDDGDLRGHSAIEYQEGPEEGLGDPQAATLGVLCAARNLLRDLLAMKGTLSWSSNQLRRPRLGESEEDGLRRELNDFAISLRGALKGVNTIAKRTSYCVLRLPEESPEREFRIQVLREVSRQVPQLIFVELAPPNLEREREFEVQAYMKHLSVHLIPMQQGRNS